MALINYESDMKEITNSREVSEFFKNNEIKEKLPLGEGIQEEFIF